jgi:hypothetical protein
MGRSPRGGSFPPQKIGQTWIKNGAAVVPGGRQTAPQMRTKLETVSLVFKRDEREEKRREEKRREV